jgi:protein-disulfide isomerase
MNDEAGGERIRRLGQLAAQDRITGTPTFFLDGQRLASESMMTPEGLRGVLNDAIAAKN